MKLNSLLIAAAALLFVPQTSFGQGGPILVDWLNPKAWPNPVLDFQSNWLDPHFPTTVLEGQTIFVATRAQLEQKHKDYYVFFDHLKQNGAALGDWESPTEHRVTLKWTDPDFPDEPFYYPDPAQLYQAIDFDQYDPGCFASLNGPYSKLSDNPVFVGQVNGTWVAFTGLWRVMGKSFTQAQIDKIKQANKTRNGSSLKSDLRGQLVNEFLALHPEINPADIPVDTGGNTLSDAGNAPNLASVCHIIPAIAPEGNGCGRNSYRNALLVSSKLKKQILKAGMPKPAFIQYCEFLATKYKQKSPMPRPPLTINYREIRSPRELGNVELQYLDASETRAFLDYARGTRASKEETPSLAPELP